MAKLSTILGYLRSKEPVYDRSHEPHLEGKPIELLALVPKALRSISSNNDKRINEAVEFPFQVGLSHCVDTSNSPPEDIFYAKMDGRNGYSRFVKNREAEPTNHLCFILVKCHNNDGYVLLALHPGRCSQPEPWQIESIVKNQETDPLAAMRAWKFWHSHAFVDGYKPIIESTITKQCPWRLKTGL